MLLPGRALPPQGNQALLPSPSLSAKAAPAASIIVAELLPFGASVDGRVQSCNGALDGRIWAPMTSAKVEQQTSGTALLVRPTAFAFNPETAATNAFAGEMSDPGVALTAQREFERLAKRLDHAGVHVLVLDDGGEPPLPDAVFPNNWVSFHGDGTLVTYPMAAPTRRLERRLEPLCQLLANAGFQIGRHVDLSQHESMGRFLEGTGSLILDRPGRRAFASLGPRTHPAVLEEFAEQMGYSTTAFEAFDRHRRPIYHTNVVLSLGTGFAILCDEAVPEEQRSGLLEALKAGGRTVVTVSFDQLERFACNILELRGRGGTPLIALSSTALASLERRQRATLDRFGELVDVDVATIERVGGGSVRCMIADIHLPRTS
jgi:hypothetical protein